MTEEVGAWAPLDGSTAGSGSIGGWSVLAATNRCKLVCTGETRRTPSSACIAPELSSGATGTPPGPLHRNGGEILCGALTSIVTSLPPACDALITSLAGLSK
jgi:hypothetical protein